MPIDTDEAILGGVPHIRGHRIGVHHVVRAFRDRDYKIPEIAGEVYPQLSESEVREAISWALDNEETFSRVEASHRERLAEIEEQATGPSDILDA